MSLLSLQAGLVNSTNYPSAADIVCGVILAISITLVAIILKEDKGYVAAKAETNSSGSDLDG